MRGTAVLAVLGALAVSACGFTPMYAEPGVGSGESAEHRDGGRR